jgi:hypothetical protein
VIGQGLASDLGKQSLDHLQTINEEKIVARIPYPDTDTLPPDLRELLNQAKLNIF